MTKSEQMRKVAAGRAKTYAVLAALYAAPPSRELAAMIRAGGLIQAPGSTLETAAEALTACFLIATADDRSDNEVVGEYTRLFVLPSGLVPHESYYADDNQRVGGHVTATVQGSYDAAAARLTSACLELPDHIGVELEFMKFLCELEAQLWLLSDGPGQQRCLDFQHAFLAEHLLRWYRPLCQRIEKEATLELYRALARLTLDFLDAERDFVPALAREAGAERRTQCAIDS